MREQPIIFLHVQYSSANTCRNILFFSVTDKLNFDMFAVFKSAKNLHQCGSKEVCGYDLKVQVARRLVANVFFLYQRIEET